jgi:hypothetical protein
LTSSDHPTESGTNQIYARLDTLLAALADV